MSRLSASYWCYRCSRFVRVSSEENISCSHCDSGFLEAVGGLSPVDSRRRFADRLDSDRSGNTRFRRARRNSGDPSPFNPVIVLRGEGGRDEYGDDGGGNESTFELYYDDGSGSGLQPLPATMSEFLMGSGFDRLLEQLAQLEINGFGRPEQPPASKVAVESLPTIEIDDSHVDVESHCAVCKEAFVLGCGAREMPCKHIYHSDCILPWLSLRNSCPVCRHELPTEASSFSESSNGEDEALGLTIWRLPGGGFAVGRFSGGRRAGAGAGERELPVVYTEMDGGFNNSGAPRRISWGSTSRARGGRFSRAFRNLFSFLGRIRSSSSFSHSHSRNAESGSSMIRSRSISGSVFSRYVRRRSRTLILEDENEMSRW